VKSVSVLPADVRPAVWQVETVSALTIEGLVKTYGSARALDDVSLNIHQGEIFALLGPNGAGKTTLIGAACGLIKKSSGRITVFGVDVDADPISPRYHIGLVPQEINFDPFFTARESLEIQAGYFGCKRDPARINELLEALSLSSKADAPTRALSGGMKRRLLIAKALVHRPRLVFLDEPTAGVDVELRRDLWNYVRKLRTEGTTVVLTTHYLEEAEELADRIGIINQGRLLLVEKKVELMQRLGERRLHVTFSAPVDSLPMGLPDAELGVDRRSVVFVERPSGRKCSEVLSSLFAAQVPILDVRIVPARLEDVLLRVLKSGAE
jgi:ABC-2 type transport system ATP-binding protein